MITTAHYRLKPLMCLVLLCIISCGGVLSDGFVVPPPGVAEYLNLNDTFFLTQSDAGGVNEAGDQFAAEVFPLDFNADGFVDLAVGAPGGDGGAGTVYLYFGSEAGLGPAAGATLGGFSLTQADAREVGVAGDQFGAAMVAGDFNGDFIEDLAVGAPGKALGAGPAAGAVFVFLGKGDGTFETGFTLDQTDVTGGVNEAGDQFGAALATGDFDSDAVSELIVGAPGDAPGGGPASGAVYIFLGVLGGTTKSTTFVLPGSSLTQADAGGVNEAGDRFGAALETAFFNGALGVDIGDGFADLAVGAPGKRPGGGPRSGAVFVFLGSKSGIPPSPGSTPGFMLTQTDARGLAGCVPSVPGGCVPGVNEEGDRFAEALGVGDLNGDGVEELVVGAPGKDGNSGAVYIFPGSPVFAAGLAEGYYITQGNAGRANEPGDEFGAALVCGVLNQDDLEELVVGAPGEGGDAGAIFVFHGVIGETGSPTARGFLLTQADAGGVNATGDRFGAVLNIEDFNDNNAADVAVGAPGDAPGGGPRSGAVFIFTGVPTGPPTLTGEDACREVAGIVRPAGPPGGPSAQPCTVTNEAGDQFGSAATSGDFNGDGFADAAFGAPGKDGSSGAVFIFPGSFGVFGLSTGFFITQADAGGVNDALDQFGTAVAAGDFNSDGFVDLAVGAPGKDGSSGAVFIFPGSLKGLTCLAKATCPTTLVTGYYITQADAGEVGEAGDQFGAALAAGDFDGDGIDDLAVGAPEDMVGAANSGSVFVFPGSGAGITTGFQITQTDAGEANEAGDQFGAALAAGDIVGTVFADLIVGAPGETLGAAPSAGRVFIFPGSAGGFTAGLFISQTDEGTEVNEAGDQFGAALVVGDFNGDFFRDLAVGAPGDDPAGVAAKTGSVFVFPGTAGPGITSGTIVVLTHASLTDAGDIAEVTPLADGDQFGAALAVGNFNEGLFADLFDDLLVGAPGKAALVATGTKGGTFTVFPGSDGSMIVDGVTLVDGISLGVFLSQKGIGGLGEDGDQFGAALVTGDFNGDGFDDVAVSAPGDGLGAEPPMSGAVSVFQSGDISFQIKP